LVPIVRLRAEPYSYSYYSGLDNPERIIVRDPDSWQTLWVRINGTLSPLPPTPAVDFSREMLVVVALGARSSGGYGILVDGANESDNAGITVTVRSISPKNCITTQREVGVDTDNWFAALKNTLRQAPDVILIGEMRDTETVRAAIQAAETGHLVMSTLHTVDATETVMIGEASGSSERSGRNIFTLEE